MTDVVIIGAGPVGLFSLFACGMQQLTTRVIDTLSFPGGQCAALYPEKFIYDVPVHPRIEAQRLVDLLVEQAAPFKPLYHFGQQVCQIHRHEGYWQILTQKTECFTARAVIIAAGGGMFGPNRPPLFELESYEGKTVHYSVQEKEVYRGKHVVIAGGGDSAVDWAIGLQEIAAHITLVHRRSKFRATPQSLTQLNQLVESGKIETVIPFQLHALEGENGYLTHVIVEDFDHQKRALQADFLLSFFGLSMQPGPIADWEVGITQGHISVNPTTMETCRTGVYAVGDIATYPGKLPLLVNGFAESTVTAHAIRRMLYPDEIKHFEHSTTRGIPSSTTPQR